MVHLPHRIQQIKRNKVTGTWQGLETMGDGAQALMEGGSHNTNLTVFSVRSQSPELGFLARDWGRGGDGGCERPLGGLAFYLPTW